MINRIGRKRTIPFGTFLNLFAIVLSLVWFSPILLSLISAFKTNGEILRDPVALPSAFRLNNFVYLWQKTKFPMAVVNSAILTISSELLIILIVPMAAYGIARHESKLTNVIYVIFISGMMVPFQVYMIPLFKQLKVIGLYGTMFGPMVVYLAGSACFGVLLYTGFIKGIPKEIEDSAMIDGATPLRTFRSIVFPLLSPATVSLLILNGMGIWNDFLMPLLVLPSDKPKTVNVEIFSFVDQFASRWDVVFAGTVCAMLPVLILFLSLQRYFVKGITAGAAKG